MLKRNFGKDGPTVKTGFRIDERHGKAVFGLAFNREIDPSADFEISYEIDSFNQNSIRTPFFFIKVPLKQDLAAIGDAFIALGNELKFIVKQDTR